MVGLFMPVYLLSIYLLFLDIYNLSLNKDHSYFLVSDVYPLSQTGVYGRSGRVDVFCLGTDAKIQTTTETAKSCLNTSLLADHPLVNAICTIQVHAPHSLLSLIHLKSGQNCLPIVNPAKSCLGNSWDKRMKGPAGAGVTKFVSSRRKDEFEDQVPGAHHC